MSWGYGFRPYVSVAQRRAKAARQTARMAKSGHVVAPVNLTGRTIATTFWGKAWCINLEAYSDYANRLPRGRTYVRNGSVVDLQISEGRVTALVSGSDLYKIDVQIRPLSPAVWEQVQKDCTGKIDSLIEMLQGRLSSGVMQTVTRKEGGLFPKPAEIKMSCSCPDWAGLCKHLAATLYGVGARLDEKPELLFVLRGVDPADLISKASASDALQQVTSATSAPQIKDADLADVFGIELESAPAPAPASKPAKRKAASALPARKKPKPVARRVKAAPRVSAKKIGKKTGKKTAKKGKRA